MTSILRKLSYLFIICTFVIQLLPVSVTASSDDYSGITSLLDEVISEYPDQSYWKDTFDGANTCYGFAKLVVYKVFGKSTKPGKNYRSWLYNGTSTSGMNEIGSTKKFDETSMKDLLSNARPGDVLQFDTGKNSRQHSIIIYSVSKDDVTVFESNVPNYLTRFHTVSYSNWKNRDNQKATLLRSDNYDEINAANTPDSGINSKMVIYPHKNIKKAKTSALEELLKPIMVKSQRFMVQSKIPITILFRNVHIPRIQNLIILDIP